MEGEKSGKRQRVIRDITKGESIQSVGTSVGNQEPNLPQQLITCEILIRLPVRCLLRFKTVCKEWNSITSGPEFAKLHLNFSKMSSSYSLVQSFVVDSDESSDMLKCGISDGEDEQEVWDWTSFNNCASLVRGVYMTGSCNGLVCFCVGSFKRPVFFCIWNPCIHEFCEIMFFKKVCSGGFGYVSSVDDYKIVTIGTSFNRWAYVYSFRANTWTEIPQLAENDLVFMSGVNGTLVDGMLYWGYGDKVTGFKLEDYTIHEVPTHEWSSIGFFCRCVCVLGGSLCAWGFDVSNVQLVQLWRLEQQGSSSSTSWVELFKLKVWGLQGCIRNISGFTKSGKILIQGYNGDFFIVDPNANRADFVTFADGKRMQTVASFTESLISPHHYLSGTNDAG